MILSGPLDAVRILVTAVFSYLRNSSEKVLDVASVRKRKMRTPKAVYFHSKSFCFVFLPHHV
jgi:hypothetical protein